MSTFTKKPIWESQDGRVFYSPKDFDDNHLLNMIPFLAKAVFSLMSLVALAKEMDNMDDAILYQELLDSRLALSGKLINEVKRRKIGKPEWD